MGHPVTPSAVVWRGVGAVTELTCRCGRTVEVEEVVGVGVRIPVVEEREEVEAVT